jgi:hypothetical protein
MATGLPKFPYPIKVNIPRVKRLNSIIRINTEVIKIIEES